MSEVKAGVVIGYVSILLRLVTQFLLTPYIIASLGKNEYGLYVLSSSLVAWFTLCDFGLSPTISKYIIECVNKKQLIRSRLIIGQGILLFAFIAVVLTIIGILGYSHLSCLFYTFTSDELSIFKILYLLMLANVILSFPFKPIAVLPSAYLRFIAPNLFNLLLSLCVAILKFLFLFYGFKSITLTLIVLSTSVVQIIWSIYYAKKYLKVKIPITRPSAKIFKMLISFSGWIFLSQLTDLIYWQAGSPILASLEGPEVVAIFGVSITIAQYFNLASITVSNILVPKVMKLTVTNGDRQLLTNTMIRYGRMQLLVLCIFIIVFIFMGMDFLKLWVGRSLGADIMYIWTGVLLMILPQIVSQTQNTGIAILQALNLHYGRSIILLFTAVLGIGLSYLLTNMYGLIGMYIGISLSYIVGQCIAMNIFYFLRVKLNVFKFFKNVYLPSIVPSLMMVIVGMLIKSVWQPDTWFSFFMIMFIYLLICAAIMYIFYLNQHERLHFAIPLKNRPPQ